MVRFDIFRELASETSLFVVPCRHHHHYTDPCEATPRAARWGATGQRTHTRTAGQKSRGRCTALIGSQRRTAAVECTPPTPRPGPPARRGEQAAPTPPGKDAHASGDPPGNPHTRVTDGRTARAPWRPRSVLGGEAQRKLKSAPLPSSHWDSRLLPAEYGDSQRAAHSVPLLPEVLQVVHLGRPRLPRPCPRGRRPQ